MNMLNVPPSLRELIAHANQFLQHARQHKTGGEDAIALLPDEDKDEGPASMPKSHQRRSLWEVLENWNRATPPKRITMILAVMGVVLLVSILLHGKYRAVSVADEPPLERDYFFHILLPTVTTSADFCKTILSAAVLNYPTPWLIRWDEQSSEDVNLRKMRATAAWLDGLPEERVDDIVLIPGSANVWFQVRPEVVLQRFYAIKQRGDRRIQELFTPETMSEQKLATKVVFASDMECKTGQDNQRGCLASAAEDGSLHYLSTNIIMGTVRDLRPLWHHAIERADTFVAVRMAVDDATVFGQILGAQETRRQALLETDRVSKAAAQGQEDFGLVLDFEREFSYAAPENSKKPEGVDWIRHDGDGNVPIPADIAGSTPPFWTFASSGALPYDTTWSSVPLLTRGEANIIPATVQPSSLSTSWWSSMWFQPHARRLLDNFVMIPSAPVVNLLDGEGREERYWSPHFEKLGAKDQWLEWRSWDDLCAVDGFKEVWAKEVFGDGFGLWIDPRL